MYSSVKNTEFKEYWMQSSENSQLNLDYAQEWIAFLKRRNLVLTIVWPVLLVLSILSSVMAIYFYQQQQSVSLQLATEVQEKSELQEGNQQLSSQLSSLEALKSNLQAELETLHSAREELSLQNNDSESKLNITSQMVDSLNQLVAELKNERSSLITKLEESDSSLRQLTQEYQDFVANSKKETIKSVSDLNKQISTRKSAYQALANRQQEMREEMDRLSNLVNSKEKQLEKVNKDKIQLQAQLKNKTNEIATYSNRLSSLQESYSALETKLSAIMSPISQKSKIKKQEGSKSNTENMTNLTGLEEIKKPIKPKKEQNSEDYDFNKITVLP